MAVRPPLTTPATTPSGGSGGQSETSPALVPHGAHAGKPALPLHRPLIMVGSRQRAHVHLISNSVSRVHAVIINTDHGSYLRDIASRVGTIVNGRPIKEVGLRHSDTIQVGSFQFKFSDPTARGPLAAAARARAMVLHVQNRPALPMAGRTVLIGQRETCDIVLPSPLVSTAHALIFELNGRHFVRDLGSRTGTFVNGQPVHQEALEVGDMIRIGETAIRYAAATADAGVLHEEEPAEDQAADQAALPALIPVTAVVPADAPQVEVFEDLAFAADSVGVPADEPVGGDTTSDSEPVTIDAGLQPVDLESPWQPEVVPPPVPATNITGTSSLDFDAVTHDASAFPAEWDTPADEDRAGESSGAIATPEDVFGADEPQSTAGDSASTGGAEELASAPGDLEPPAKHASFAPLPSADNAVALDPDLDFPPDSDSVATALDQPFGPLTDLSLDLPHAHEDASIEARPLIESVEAAPEADGARPFPAASDAVEAEVEPAAPQLSVPVAESEAPSSVSPETVGTAGSEDEPSALLPVATFDLVDADVGSSGMPAGSTLPAPESEPAPSLVPVAEMLSAAPAAIPPSDLASIEIEPPAPDVSATIPPGVEREAPPEDIEPASGEAPAGAASTVGESHSDMPTDVGTAAPVVGSPAALPTDDAPRTGKNRGGRKAVAKRRRAWGKKAPEIAEAEATAPSGVGDAAVLNPQPEAPATPQVLSPQPPADSIMPANERPASIAEMSEAEEPLASVGNAEILPPPPVSEILPPAVQGPATTETLAPTEPSPESALDFGLSDADAFLTGGGLADDVSMTSADAPLNAELNDARSSDPAFDAMIEEFVGSSTGPIVEDPEGVAAKSSETAADPSLASPPLDLDADGPPVPADADSWPVDPLSFEDAGVDGWKLPDKTSGQADPNDAIAQPPEASALLPAFDPFLGMGRDAGSFIGGMPLGPLTPDPFSIGAPPTPAPLFGNSTETDPGPASPQFEPDVESLDGLGLPPLQESDAFEEPVFNPIPSGESATHDLQNRDGLESGTLHEAELELALPELNLPDLPETPPGDVSGSVADEPLDADALDLPDLAAQRSAPGAPAKAGGEEEVDPLLFTEAESPTLHFLPTPARPPVDPAGGVPTVRSPVNEGRREPQGGLPAAKGRGSGAPAGSAHAARSVAPSKYPPTPPPPARSSTPRRAAPRAPFDLDATIPGAGVGLPAGGLPGSLSGGLPGGAGGAAHAFDGLAVPPVREMDVFSGLPLGADDPVLRGSRPAAPRKSSRGTRGEANEIPPSASARRASRAADLAATPEDLAPLQPLAPLPPLTRPKRGGRAGPAAAPLHADPHPAHAGQDPHDGSAMEGVGATEQGWPDGGFAPPPRRHIGIGTWLAMMILTLGATSAAILFFAPKPGVEVIGTLQFERLRDLSELQRREFEKDQRDWLARPDFRGQAREILLVSHAGVAPGFLGNDDQAIVEYEKIVSGTHVKERGGSLTLPYRGNDPDGDPARIEALLKALNAVNKPRRDQAARALSQFNLEEKKLNDLTAELEAIKRRAAALRDKAESVPELEAKLRTMQAEDQRLRAAVTEARREVDRLRGELGRAQAAVPALPRGPGLHGGFFPTFGADVMALHIASALLLPPSASTQPATAPADDDAVLQEWVARLADIESALSHRPTAVQPAPGPDGMTERRTAQTRERRQAGANDPVFRRMQQQLAVKERHRNAALGGGLTQDAARLDGEIADLMAQLGIDRELIAAGLPDEQTAELKQLIGEPSGQAAPSRGGRADPSINRHVNARDTREELESEASALRKKIDSRRDELAAAREAAGPHLAAPAMAIEGAGASAPGQDVLEESIAMVQDAPDDPAIDSPPTAPRDEQAPAAPVDPPASAEKIKADLAAAERREADANAAAARSGEAVLQARTALDDAKRAERELASTLRDQQSAIALHGKQVAAVEALRNELATIVVPVEPGPDAIAVNPVGDDRRYLYMLVAGAFVVIAFSLLMWLSSHGGQSLTLPDRDNPFEAPVIGAPIAGAAGADPNADDERPLVV